MFFHDISREIFNLGDISIRWYGFFFAAGIILNYVYTRWIFKRESHRITTLESIVIYLFLGMVIGARLGHIFFYNPVYYLNNPLEIFMIWKGGLASHGAAIGVFVAYLIWIAVHRVKFTKYADLLVLGMPLTAGFVRIGNFFNSEIVGKYTGGTWGVVFQQRGETIPRHPSQLYEAAASFLIFLILYLVYRSRFKKLPKLFVLFSYIFLYFSTRFFLEYFKERHVVPAEFPLSMGQILSIVPVLIALAYYIFILIGKRKS